MKRATHICPDCASNLMRLPRNAGRGLIWLYRHTFSLLVGYNCRHLPTCSAYADEAIERFGLWGGGWMTLARLLRQPAPSREAPAPSEISTRFLPQAPTNAAAMAPKRDMILSLPRYQNGSCADRSRP